MKRIYNSLKQGIQRRCKYVETHLLTKQFFRESSYAVSHGCAHFFLFIIVGIITGFWWHHQTSSSNEVMHNIGIGFIRADNDTITTLGYDLIIDSDTIRSETNGKYHSAIKIHYFGKVDTAQSLITIYAKPFLSDCEVVRDTVFKILDKNVVDTVEICEDGTVWTRIKPIYRDTVVIADTNIEPEGDSVFNISVTPAKNLQLPLGGWMAGKQTITVYSNQLGLSEQSSTYNYYLGFGRTPHVTNTERDYGYSEISFLIGDMDYGRAYSTYFSNRSLTYSFVYPNPDILSIGYLSYFSADKFDAVMKNQGIIIQCEDLDTKNKNNRKAIIYSVLVGTGVAFLLDILVQLVRELRNVNRRNEDQKTSEQKTSETLDKRKDDEDD